MIQNHYVTDPKACKMEALSHKHKLTDVLLNKFSRFKQIFEIIIKLIFFYFKYVIHSNI